MIAIHIPDNAAPTLVYAREELAHWLSTQFDEQSFPYTFTLTANHELPPFSWSITSRQQHIHIEGHDAACVLHGVYTLLERAGCVFEIDGQHWRADASLDHWREWSSVIQPAVNWRGIRQHLNFPMDISSYSLQEALAYIRSLARLRFNHITFHSYPDQWYEVPLPNGSTRRAGYYFYGQRHDLPDHPLRTVIRNQHTFCIPEHERELDDEAKNSRNAIAWLQAVVAEAKRVGLRVQFSCELRERDLAESLATVASILKDYPQIDVLEIITQESGEWGHAAPAETLRKIAAEHFPGSLADETITPHLVDGQKDLDRLMLEIAHAIQVFTTLRESGKALPHLALGVYCTVRSDHAVIMNLLRRYTPSGVSYALLFDHGNRAVARNLSDLQLTRADWQRSMIYSWVEFDGTIYLLQNALEGIHQLVKLAAETNAGSPIHALSFNHWRTAENRTPLRYAAQMMVEGLLSPEAFYREYARSLSIGREPDYAAAMQIIDDADTQARDQLPNVGFCYVGCWGSQGLGYYGVFKADRLQLVRSHYEDAHRLLTACAQATHSSAGASYLAFLLNRTRCTVVYLSALETAVQLQALCADRLPSELDDHDKRAVMAICDASLAQMEDYMTLHAQMLPDRGSEGTLISFYYTPPAVLKRIRAEFSGIGNAVQAASAHDAPPSPIWMEE
ncbi:MAG: hypothetical protein JNJ61_16655 [Anaerolineae bacterium]|nr:hypothetical protein [Anaerolineae bacterium]